MFFRSVRKYYQLKNVPCNGLTFNVDRGENRFFISFRTLEVFIKWYDKLPPQEKTLNEVVITPKRKLILDIDITDADNLFELHMYDFEIHISRKIRNVFDFLDIGTPHIIIYNMSNDVKISYHFVVSNYIFDLDTCLGLSIIISKDTIWQDYLDTSIYKNIQCIRIEGSTKFNQRRWKCRTNLNGKYCQGLISNFDDTLESDFKCNVNKLNYKPLMYIDYIDNDQFKYKKKDEYTYILQRIKPGFCPQCKRIHCSENAMVKIINHKAVFICWRYYSMLKLNSETR